MSKSITVRVKVAKSISETWNFFTSPEHIVNWNQASEDWHCPKATNDLVVGGKFVYRMEARDRSSGFAFSGIYTKVDYPDKIEYTLDDGRKVSLLFLSQGEFSTQIVETFELEDENSEEKQRSGWQSILDSFQKYSEDA